jgi:hypothetical protein
VPRRGHNVAGGIDVDRAAARQIGTFSSSAMKDDRTPFDTSGNRLRIGDITFDDFDRETRERRCAHDTPYEYPNLGAALEHQPLDKTTTDES